MDNLTVHCLARTDNEVLVVESDLALSSILPRSQTRDGASARLPGSHSLEKSSASASLRPCTADWMRERWRSDRRPRKKPVMDKLGCDDPVTFPTRMNSRDRT